MHIYRYDPMVKVLMSTPEDHPNCLHQKAVKLITTNQNRRERWFHGLDDRGGYQNMRGVVEVVGSVDVAYVPEVLAEDPVELGTNTRLRLQTYFIVTDQGLVYTNVFGKFNTIAEFAGRIKNIQIKGTRRARTLFHAARRAGCDLQQCTVSDDKRMGVRISKEQKGERLVSMIVDGRFAVIMHSNKRFGVEAIAEEFDAVSVSGTYGHVDTAFEALELLGKEAIRALIALEEQRQRFADYDRERRYSAAELEITRLRSLL